jgi:hypothetical protein
VPSDSSIPSPTPAAGPASRPLGLGDHWPCPLCRQGQLEALVLTDAFACDFCRHILSADIQQQQVQVVDSSQPMAWRWTGEGWRSLHHPDTQLTPLIWIAAGLLLLVPSSLVAVASYLFPPLNPTPGPSFGEVWASLTLACHVAIVLWLLGEHYQVPMYVAAKVRWLQQRTRSTS